MTRAGEGLAFSSTALRTEISHKPASRYCVCPHQVIVFACVKIMCLIKAPSEVMGALSVGGMEEQAS